MIPQRPERPHIMVHCAAQRCQRWTSNFRQSGIRLVDRALVMGAVGYAHDDPQAVVAGCQMWRELGARAVPGVGHMLSRVHGHHERSAWLDQAVWTDAAKWIDYFVAHVPRCTDIVVDLEPYWDGDDRFTWLADNPELVVAMSPLWQAFRRHGVRPWIMPGGHLYHYCAWIPRDLAWVCLSELTFTDHADADLARLRAWAARVRCAFIPGLTCNHIRDGGRALAQRGVRAAWIHFSGPDAADYWNFGLVPWFLQRGAAS